MIVEISGWQDSGKTLIAQAIVHQQFFTMPVNGVVSNIALPYIPKAQYLSSLELRAWVGDMVKRDIRRWIVFVDEVDSVWPARFWKDKAQVEQMLPMYMDEHLQNLFLYTSHRGKGVDKILRDHTQITCACEYDRMADEILIYIQDNRYSDEVFTNRLRGASRFWRLYHRWARLI